MAIIGKHYTPEMDFETAYFKIDKVVVSCQEYEILHPGTIGWDDEREHNFLSYVTKYEGSATMKVYMDEGARKNLVRVVDTLTFTFEYDLHSEKNVFTQAYESIMNSGYIEDGVSA